MWEEQHVTQGAVGAGGHMDTGLRQCSATHSERASMGNPWLSYREEAKSVAFSLPLSSIVDLPSELQKPSPAISAGEGGLASFESSPHLSAM